MESGKGCNPNVQPDKRTITPTNTLNGIDEFDNLILFFNLITFLSFNLCKGLPTQKSRLMSYGANDIKFEEGVETMMQTYQL